MELKRDGEGRNFASGNVFGAVLFHVDKMSSGLNSMGESGQIITWVHVLLYLQHISDKQTQPYNKLQLKIIFTLSLTSPLQALNSAAPNNQNLWMHHKPGFPFT